VTPSTRHAIPPGAQATPQGKSLRIGACGCGELRFRHLRHTRSTNSDYQPQQVVLASESADRLSTATGGWGSKCLYGYWRGAIGCYWSGRHTASRRRTCGGRSTARVMGVATAYREAHAGEQETSKDVPNHEESPNGPFPLHGGATHRRRTVNRLIADHQSFPRVGEEFGGTGGRAW
jgi:hypothetical protein